MDEKTCRDCGETKPLDEFSRDRHKKDGRTSDCLACRRVKSARWAGENREWISNYNESNKHKARERYARNRDLIAEQARTRRQMRDRGVEWRRSYLKRAERLGLAPALGEPFSEADMVATYGPECHYCGGAFECIDHYLPISKGGAHSIQNVRPSCLTCNNRKGGAEPLEWEARRRPTP